MDVIQKELGNFKEITRRLLQAADSPTKDQATLEGLKSAYLLFLELRNSNRKLSVLMQNSKSLVQEKKRQGDESNLKLQSLLYEKSHTEKEIKKCRGFRTGENKDMVSTEQYQQAQPEVAASLSTHALQLARFEFELAERNRLLAQVEELKKARDAQQAANLLLSQRVEDITQKFDKVKKDALVVKQLLFDDSLQIPTNEALVRDPSSLQLPLPLYNLYCSAMSYKTFFDKSLAISILPFSSSSSTSSPTPDAGDDANLEKEGSLAITLHGATLIFSFVPKLLSVSVDLTAFEGGLAGLNRRFLLSHLYPDDDGLFIPLSAGSPGTVRGEAGQNEQASEYFCYRWAQAVCGLEVPHPSSLGATKTGEYRPLPAAFCRIQARVLHRKALQKKLAELQSQKVTRFEGCSTTLEKWRVSSAVAFNKCPPSSESRWWNQDGALYFAFTLKTVNVSVAVLVFIGVEYPQRVPFFKLQTSDSRISETSRSTINEISQTNCVGSQSLLEYCLEQLGLWLDNLALDDVFKSPLSAEDNKASAEPMKDED